MHSVFVRRGLLGTSKGGALAQELSDNLTEVTRQGRRNLQLHSDFHAATGDSLPILPQWASDAKSPQFQVTRFQLQHL